LRPIAANAAAVAGFAAAEPDATMSSWPASAGPLLPDTGASTNVTSGRTRPSRLASPVVAVTPMVPICAHTAPGANGGRPSANSADSTTSASGSMVITTRASRIASGTEAAGTAPTAASGVVASVDRSHTVVDSPAATRLRAMAEPMMPVPSTATLARSGVAFGSLDIEFSYRVAQGSCVPRAAARRDGLSLAADVVIRHHTAG
jgi:hypothetical protein